MGHRCIARPVLRRKDGEMGSDHDHGHHHAPATFGRAFAVGIALNLAFIVAEVAAGFFADAAIAALFAATDVLAGVCAASPGFVAGWLTAAAAGVTSVAW